MTPTHGLPESSGDNLGKAEKQLPEELWTLKTAGKRPHPGWQQHYQKGAPGKRSLFYAWCWALGNPEQ